MKTFNYSEYCLKQLFQNIPEIPNLEGELKEELKYILDGGLGAHTVYEDVFCYFVLDLINKQNPNQKEKEIIRRSFELIEELANHEDFDVRCVADVSFIEPLLDKIEPTKKIEEYLHPKSLEMAREIARSQFGLNPYTWEKEK